MLEVKTFSFNAFGVNTYLLWNSEKQAIIIDSGNSSNDEHTVLLTYIEIRQLKIEGIYLTHTHIDHIVGANFLSQHFDVPVFAHSAGNFLFKGAQQYAAALGFDFDAVPKRIINIDEGHQIVIGESVGEAIYTPGHVDGSLCYYFKSQGVVFTGDVLFRQGVGRTDLETGDFKLLEKSITQKLYQLPNDTLVFPGHGPSTSIGFEKRNNPFFQD